MMTKGFIPYSQSKITIFLNIRLIDYILEVLFRIGIQFNKKISTAVLLVSSQITIYKSDLLLLFMFPLDKLSPLNFYYCLSVSFCFMLLFFFRKLTFYLCKVITTTVNVHPCLNHVLNQQPDYRVIPS